MVISLGGVDVDYNQAKSRLAPCGLDCSRCADYDSGEIQQISSRLTELLGNYRRLAAIKANTFPVFQNYQQFEDVLSYFSQASCSGCRGENVKCPINCPAQTCHKEKGVDFCFQCDEYPCDKPFPDAIENRWRTLNDRMKKIGVEKFCIEQDKKPRY
ncbi:DUF3795 domain-containing protein [Heliobacillus mobilis]|uniref:DUF3795 domain-containing protein n=1 Tax=Heliobacterium mobile TaxID=28064 RepID=A0A6I3SMA9_HELMO|nr:DUF3795 domain-containing protein [Heliobacterium mobile]